ncbi:DUF7408 domain-containing protein [Paenibacillus sp. JCM 10914]
MYTKKRGIVLFLAMLLLSATLSLALPAGQVYADTAKIGIQSELGYQGKVKSGKWNPLKLTLTSDRDISGDIVIQIQNNMGYGQQTSYVQRVELPKDTPKELLIGLPGTVLNKDNNQILFYEDSYTKGKPTAFDSGRNYVQASPYQGALIAVLADDPDTMNFMNVLNGKGSSLNQFSIKAGNIPSDPMLLNGLDVLVINNFASDTLTEPQRKSIIDWVNGGGTLVLAGGAGYAKSAAPFADIAPVQSSGTTSVQSLTELEQLGGKPLKLDGTFTISTANLAEGAEGGITADGQPLFASHAYGQGKVQYAAYDLAMDPVGSWAGHADAWASLLRNSLPVSSQNGMYGGSFMDNLNYVLEYFPALKMPSFTLLLWMLLIYAVIVAPILYFILKRADKREWAWFLIPIIAVIASGAVYFVGSADKTRELAHTINVIKLNGQGDGVKSSASAFFTPRSGNYQLEFSENTYLKTGRNQTTFGSGLGENTSFVRNTPEATTLELRDMPQWSLAKIWSESQGTEPVGRFALDLKLDGSGQLTGAVTNETINDLTEVVLVVGGKGYKLGDVAQGASVSVPQDQKQVLKFVGSDLSNILYPYVQNDTRARERDILNNYSWAGGYSNKDAYIMGWSKDRLTTFTLKGTEVDSDQLNYWVQPVSMNWEVSGELNIPYGFLSPEISQVNAPMYASYPHGIEMGQGMIVGEFPLITEGSVQYSEISIKGTKFNQNVTMEIWNVKESKWEPVDNSNNEVVYADHPEQYIVDNRVRFMITASDQTNFTMPELSVKGEATP